MSARTLIEAGILSRVAWYIDHGYSYSKFQGWMSREFPSENATSRLSIWNAGEAARSAGIAAESAGGSGSVPASLVPGYYPGRTGYRYTVQATFRSDSTGDERVITYSLDSSTQLEREDIDTESEDRAPGQGAPTIYRKSGEDDGQEWTYVGSEILALERW